MIKEKNILQIKQNKSDVFTFLTTDSNLTKWVNGIVAIRPVGEHQNKAGDAVYIDVNVPKKATIKSTLTRWDPPNQFATSYEAGGMTGNMQYQLVQLSVNTTEVTYTASHYPQSFMMKLFSPLIAWVIKKERKKELIRLQNVLEDNNKNS